MVKRPPAGTIPDAPGGTIGFGGGLQVTFNLYGYLQPQPGAAADAR